MRRLRKNNLVRFLAASGVFVCAMIFSSFSYAAGGHSHIRAALCTIDQIKAASDADPGDTELKTLRDLFFNGDTPKEEMIKAFTRGSALPDTLGVFIGSIFKAGSFLHYGDTGLFYTLLLAKSGNYKSGKYVYGEESIAFALGAISHYVVDKYSHPIINEFAGASYEVAADHEVVGVNLDDGTVYKDKPHYKPLADEVTKRHKFYEFWLIRYELDQAGVDSINTTPELADDFKYYIFDFTYSHSKDYAEIIDNVFTKLWGNWWNNFGISPGRINRADTEMTIFIWYLSRCYIKNREANLTNDISKLCKYIPLPKVLLPTKDVSNKFQDDLASVVDPSGKVFYAGLSKKFLDCIDKVSPEETIKVFRRMAPFLKDMVVDKITVNDLKLDNINLDTGKLTTEAENKKRGIPDVAKDTNPKKTRAYITNRGANTLRSMEIDGDDLDFKPDVTVDSNPQAVVFDSTGRFAWVINRGSNTVSWVDTAEDEEVDQDRMDSKPVTRITVGSDPVALAMSPDDARLYVANNGSQTVSVIDTYKRELINTIPSSPLDPSLDVDLIHYIKVDPNGEYVYLSAEKQKAGVIKQINLKTKAVVTFALQNSRDPRGLAVDPSGKNILLIDHGETVRKGGYLHNVNIAGGIDEPVYPTIKGNMMRRMEVIDRQWFWCTVSTAPEIISILCEMSLPPVGIYDEIGGVDGLVEMTSFLGFSFLGFSFFWDIPWVVTLTYKTDPLFLRRGTNIDIPAVEKYTNYNTDFALACACFDYTGNIGFFDRKKKEFFAATKSILGDEWMSRLFTSYSNLAVSSIGDIIAMDLARDKAAFYPGKKLFKALAEDPEVLSRRPVDESDIWDLYGTIRSTVSPELIGKLNKPSSAAIQPEVYFPLSLFGRVIEGDKTNEGAQLDFMIFSRQDIKAIEVFQVEDNGSFTPLQFNGTDLEWAQKYDRFWELIVNDTINGQLNLGNQDSGKIKVNFKVTLDNGAVLNLGEAAEIKQIKSIQPPLVNLELEGIGDSQEENPGGFIMLNDDDDDKDGKADNAQPGPVNNEDDLVKLIIKPVELAADYSGSVTLKITQGASKIKIWDSKTKNNEITLPQTYSTPVGLPKELWVEGAALSGADRDVELVLEYNYIGGTVEDKIKVIVLKVNMVPDYNHDREINNDDKSLLTSGGLFHFWVNDDDDNGNEASGDSDQPGHWDWGTSPADYSNAKVDGRCDLLDFFPVWLDLSQILNLLPPSETVQYKLKQANGAVKAVYTDLIKGHAGSFLTTAGNLYGPKFNQNSYEADTFKVTSSGVTLSTDFLNKIKNDATKGILLMEGASATTSPLVLEIWKDGAKIGGKEILLKLKLSGVEAMYRWINLRSSGGSSTGEPTNNPDALSNGKNVFFVHGFWVSAEAARDWNAEIFKRLYQSGSLAKFWGMTWEGDIGVFPPLNYQANAANALAVSSDLNAQISEISGTKIILAHSLGNMVVSSAIQDHHLSVDKYFMLDAAVATECYDPTAFNDTTTGNYMLRSDWSGYNANTWCSKWFELFSSPDDRAKLTWKNRFPAVLSVAYNFYSSGDEVFEVFPGTPGPFTGGLFPFHPERYSWQKQEMSKGGCDFGGTDWAGWGFDGHYTMAQANAASDDDLRTNPVFLHEPTKMFSSNITSSVVNDIIAKGVPALSYAAGKNRIEGVVKNYDVNVHEPNGWGRSGGTYDTCWLHNDLKDMAYFYTYGLFNQIVLQGELDLK